MTRTLITTVCVAIPFALFAENAGYKTSPEQVSVTTLATCMGAGPPIIDPNYCSVTVPPPVSGEGFASVYAYEGGAIAMNVYASSFQYGSPQVQATATVAFLQPTLLYTSQQTIGTASAITSNAIGPNAGSNPFCYGINGLVQGQTPTFFSYASADGEANLYTAVIGPAATVTTLTGLNGTGYGSLVQAVDGSFYGTTYSGGIYGYGTIFRVTTTGILTTLYDFTGGSDGAYPFAGVIQTTDGNFFGTTSAGGTSGQGTVFKVTPNSVFTSLHSFSGPDGSSPQTRLVQGSNGYGYGTTTFGGTYNFGTIFKINSSGELTTLYSFSGATDGANPAGALILSTDGNFYGTAEYGGSSACYGGCGTIFTVSQSGNFKTWYSFTGGGDGGNPNVGLIQATNGQFYGATLYNGSGLFTVTSTGVLTTLHRFSLCFDGVSSAVVNVFQASDGNLYGTGLGVDPSSNGLFQATTSGTVTPLYLGTVTPQGGITQGTDGNLYGTGATVYQVATGLTPFVQPLPGYGKVSTIVSILGSDLTGSTGVAFNGTPSNFTIVSPTEISTVVPNQATTGPVAVVTPGGSLASNVPFLVTPVISNFYPKGGAAGTTVYITGQSFTGASAVTFGGVTATKLRVKSYNEITAVVPPGAKSGKITVTTPGGRAISADAFKVN